jgi:RNA polymerase sigma-70 factor (ECF subfamily)
MIDPVGSRIHFRAMSNSSCLESPFSLAMVGHVPEVVHTAASRGTGSLGSGSLGSGSLGAGNRGSGNRGTERAATGLTSMGSGKWNREQGDSSSDGALDARSGAEPVLPPRVRLERLFNHHHTVVWRTLRRMGADAELAADLTQQAFLVVAERMADIRQGAERGFLFTTALTLLHTRRRRESRCQLEDDMARFGGVESRDVLTSQSYARQILDRVLADLDPQLVVVFALFELEGMTTPEISTTLRIPLGTAASRLRRAREAFRLAVDRLEQSCPEGESSGGAK